MENEKAIVSAGESERAMLAAERETRYEMAIRCPRDEKRALEDALAGLEMFPEYAGKSFYVIPYKSKGETKDVEGPSIGAAMDLQQAWRNSDTAGRIKNIDEKEEYAEVEGAFLDYETNTRVLRTLRVNLFWLDRDTKAKRPMTEDKKTAAIQAGMSKVIRNATLAGLPKWLVMSYHKKAKELAARSVKGAKTSSVDDRLKTVVTAFKKYGVSAEQVAAYVESRRDDIDTPEEMLAHLIGIGNAIKDGQTRPEEVFGAQQKAEEPKSGQVSLEDVIGGGK